MKPLLFEFIEEPDEVVVDNSLLEYSSKLNLTVLKNTQEPAINFATLNTETFTKSIGEMSDSDNNDVKNLINTMTKTGSGECTDNDPVDIYSISKTMSTKTYSLNETSDSD